MPNVQHFCQVVSLKVQVAFLPPLHLAQHIMEMLLSAQHLIKTQINNVQKQQTFAKRNPAQILLHKQVLLLAQAT